MNDYNMPSEWVDRIFKRLAEIYGERFASRFLNPSYIDMHRSQWQSGLLGVTAEEIKQVLNLCKTGFIHNSPTVIEFYHYCKGVKQPLPVKLSEISRTEAQQKNGEKYIKLIMDKLHGRSNSDGDATLPSIGKQILAKQEHTTTGHWQDN